MVAFAHHRVLRLSPARNSPCLWLAAFGHSLGTARISHLRSPPPAEARYGWAEAFLTPSKADPGPATS